MSTINPMSVLTMMTAPIFAALQSPCSFVADVDTRLETHSEPAHRMPEPRSLHLSDGEHRTPRHGSADMAPDQVAVSIQRSLAPMARLVPSRS
jgi:hypothetical protein